jgi:sugar (pentulose or hexulose) kinase
LTTEDLILAIDNGTQSLKALIFDLHGQLVAKEMVPFTPYFSAQPGWAEQDPDVFWQALCQACQNLWQRKAVAKTRIAGVALTTQRATVVNVDESGKPLRPAILWLDQRKTFGLPPVGGIWGALFRVAGLRKTVAYLQEEAEANWVRTYQPEIWKHTDRRIRRLGRFSGRLHPV